MRQGWLQNKHNQWYITKYKTKLVTSFLSIVFLSRVLVTLVIITFATFAAPPAYAANFNVTNFNDAGAGSLRDAITQTNASGTNDTITFTAGVGTITLASQLPLIQKPGLTLSINAGGPRITVDSNNTGAIFFVYDGTITAANFDLNRGFARGGHGGTTGSGGGGAGGGGLGAGGAVFVNDTAIVTLTDINFNNNTAQGGNGGVSGVGLFRPGAGGGGMLRGNGGSCTVFDDNGSGGGGVGPTALGGDTSQPGGAGLIIGATAGGAGSFGVNPTAGGINAGGGGGGSTLGVGAGGGGGGDVGGPAAGNGLAGGSQPGGAGAFGGGGGGASAASPGAANGGAGGFGGGGGGSNNTVASNGGAAGFGGGAGGSGSGNTNGGAGSGLGGAIFVHQGGTLTVRNTNSDTGFTGNAVAAGTTSAAAGQALGQDLYLHTGTTAIFDTAAGRIQTSTGTVAGTGGINKTSAGTFVTTAANTYTGGTTVSGGVLEGSTTSLQGNITDNANVTFNQNTNGTYAGVISETVAGAGTVTKLGTGIVTFTGANTYTGGTTISAGTLRMGAANSLAATGTVTVNTPGVFDLNNNNQTIGHLAGSGSVTLGNAILTFGTNDLVSSTFSGIISGTGSINKTLTNTEILTGANTYSGGTTVSGGTLQGTTTGLQGAITNNSFLVFDQTFNGTYAGVISGTGSVTKQGSGIVSLNGANNYTGGTIVSAGTLRTTAVNRLPVNGNVTVNVGGTLDLSDFNQTIGNLSGTGGSVTLGAGTLTVGSAGSSTYSGVISGVGNLTKQGAGTLTLAGVNLYTGMTNINAGTLAVSGGLSSLTTVNAGTILRSTGGGVVSGAVTNSGTVDFNGGGFTGTITGLPGSNVTVSANSFTGASIVNVPTITVNIGTNFTVGNTISGFTNFTNNGTLTLNTGGDIIGPITAGAGSIINVDGDYTNNGTLAATTLNVLNNATLTAANNITATNFTVNGGGTLELNPITITGPLINNGTVSLLAMNQPGGTATVTGAFSQGGGGTLISTLNSTASYGRLTSTAGGGTFSGSVTVSLPDNGLLISDGDLFTLVSGVNMPVSPTLVQPTSAVLSFVRDTTAPPTTYRLRAVRTSFDDVNNVPANDGVGSALETIRELGAPDGLANIITALDAQTSQAGLENALAQLLPADVNGGAVYSSMNTPNLVLDKISVRAENLRYGMNTFSNLGSNTEGYNAGDEYTYMLANQATYGPIVFGNWAKQQANAGVAGYSYGTAGFGVLADTPTDSFYISPLRLGAGVSYAQSVIKTDNFAGNMTGNKIIAGSFQMIGYGLWDYRWIFIDGSAYYGLNNYRSTRNILITNQVASGKYAGLQWGGRIRGGIAVPIYTVNITPMGELQYTHLTLRQYTETGAPGANLTVSGREISAAQAAIGVKFAEISEPESFIPEIHVWYLNTFKNPSLIQNAFFVAGGPAFSTVGPPLAKNGIDVGGSITARLTNGSVLNAGYDLEMRNKYTNNIGFLKIRIVFLGGYTCCD